MSVRNAAEECLTIDFKFDPLEVDETVDDVEKLIREEFPGLETLPLMWNGVLCQKITSKEIMEQKYSFHPFYAILTRRNDSKLEIKLVAFNGKLVSSEVVESIGSLKQGSGILNNLTETKLCQGIRELEDIHNSKHLLEYLNDEVVCRHMKCRYRISPSRSSNTTLCSNCQRLRDSIQPETRGSSPSSISTRTKSRNKKRKIDYNEEELDDNNFQELKLEYLEEEDVYLDINMSDTQVGIVSITDREDCPENVKIKLPDVSEQGDQIKKQSSPSDESLGKNYACQYCQSQLQSKLSKTKHEKNCKKSNSPPEVRKPARVEKLKCPVCFAQFRYDKNFDLHMEIHKAKDSYFQTIECPDCSVKIQGSDINIHYAKTHDPDMGVCLACLRCMKKASLPTHYSSNHRMTLPRLKKTYLCTECGKVFK